MFHTALHWQLSLSWVHQCVCARFWSWRQTRFLCTPQLCAEGRLWPWHAQFQQDRVGLGSSTRMAKGNCHRATACDKATRLWWGKANGGEGDIRKLPKEKPCGAPLKIQGMRNLHSSLQISLCETHSPFISFLLIIHPSFANFPFVLPPIIKLSYGSFCLIFPPLTTSQKPSRPNFCPIVNLREPFTRDKCNPADTIGCNSMVYGKIWFSLQEG